VYCPTNHTIPICWDNLRPDVSCWQVQLQHVADCSPPPAPHICKPSPTNKPLFDLCSRDNLEPDVSFWQAQLQRVPSVQDILEMAKSHPQVSG
jgi:hypothetical protein